MSDRTGIEWTDATWNPIVGCSVVSPGCTNCYAMAQAARIEKMQDRAFDAVEARRRSPYAGLTQASKAGPVWNGKVALASEGTLTQPLRWKRPRRIFVNSMGDLFHESVPDGWIAYVWDVMCRSPHTFQVLTKRPKRMREWISRWCDLTGDADPLDFRDARGPDAVRKAHPSGRGQLFASYLETLLEIAGGRLPDGAAFPPFDWAGGWKYWPDVAPNIWLGVSAEDQPRADARIPDLLATPAAVRFVSCEPLLGEISFRWAKWDDWRAADGRRRQTVDHLDGLRQLDWIIVGGESGPSARPMHPDWARAIRDQCKAAGTPFFFKQWGEFVVPYDGERACRVCGCTDHWACEPDSCSWIEPDLCSACRGKPTPTERAVKFHRVGKRRAGSLLDGVEHKEWPR